MHQRSYLLKLNLEGYISTSSLCRYVPVIVYPITITRIINWEDFNAIMFNVVKATVLSQTLALTKGRHIQSLVKFDA